MPFLLCEIVNGFLKMFDGINEKYEYQNTIEDFNFWTFYAVFEIHFQIVMMLTKHTNQSILETFLFPFLLSTSFFTTVTVDAL